MWEPRCRAAGLTPVLDDVPDVVIFSDGDRLEQILSNLVDNAVHFTPRGGTVRLFSSVEDGRVQVGAQDTGVGIAAADLPRI